MTTRRLNCALATILICCTSTTAEEYQVDRFQRTTLCQDLIQPMELELAPDGSIFIIELAGKLKRLNEATGQVEVVGEVEVTTAQENGLIGLALDPSFAENQWIYLQYSPPDFPGQHISRFDFRDGKLDLTSEKLLLKYEEQRRECCHHAGSLEFGPGGLLYIGTGDNTNPFNDSAGYAPIDQRPDREPWDAARSAGNTKSYNGKILRIRPEPDGTYSIPEGNLFPADGSVGHPEIYVMGCRNPWRINVDQSTGYLYWGDVGPDAGQDNERGPRGYDEVNQARVAGNFGWPFFIGNNFAYAMVDFETGEIGAKFDPAKPLNESVNNTGARELPPAQPAMIYYPGGATAEFPAVGTGGRTACAGPVYYYDPDSTAERRFPAHFDRTLFAFDWSRSAIWAAHLDEDSQLSRLEPFLPNMSFVRPIDMQFSPAGSLYVIEYGETWGVNPDAQLIRLDYVRGNRHPVAVAKLENTVGREPLVVVLSAEGSSDPDGDALEYRWLSTRSGQENPTAEVLATTRDASIEFDQAGIYTIQLEVVDPAGAIATRSFPVIVGNSTPEISFLLPQDGDFVDPGAEVQFELMVRDLEDGTSDIDEYEAGLLPYIEEYAPSRIQVEAKPATSGMAEGEVPPGLALIRTSDCLNCHAPDRQLVGPSFISIADKYRNQPHALPDSVKRVLEGSTGVWGKVGMLPHAQHTPAEVTQMVEYVYSFTADTSYPTAQGFKNRITLPADATSVQLQATYTDLGRDEIPALSAVATVQLRSRHAQAESADRFAGMQPLGSANAEGNKFMGAINHDGFLQFSNLRLDKIQQIVVRVASAGAGGDIEVHRGAADGPLLGKIAVEVNGAWEEFYEKTIPLDMNEIAAGTRDDLFLVFKNEKNRGGLMNIDSLRFEE